MPELNTVLAKITPLNLVAQQAAKTHFNQLIKPVGSLAKLEDMVCLYAGASGISDPLTISYPRRAILLWREEAAEPKLTPLTVLAKSCKCIICSEQVQVDSALTQEAQITAALVKGLELTKTQINTHNLQMLGLGAIGRFALPAGWTYMQTWEAERILNTIGSLSLAAQVGSILAAAALRVPIMLDGLAVALAACIATKMNATVLAYCIATHATTELGQEQLLETLHLSPVLRLNIRQGQGEGCALAFTLFDAGIKAYTEMETFAQAGVHAEVEAFAQTKTSQEQSEHEKHLFN
ncbi:MAG: nicotinate-nucleotide--dimethylbenzimidazole phosphoribosyltransferase [Acidaminococcaceae bacterium]